MTSRDTSRLNSWCDLHSLNTPHPVLFTTSCATDKNIKENGKEKHVYSLQHCLFFFNFDELKYRLFFVSYIIPFLCLSIVLMPCVRICNLNSYENETLYLHYMWFAIWFTSCCSCCLFPFFNGVSDLCCSCPTTSHGKS